MCWQMIRISVQTAKRPNWAKAAVVSLYCFLCMCSVWIFSHEIIQLRMKPIELSPIFYYYFGMQI